MTRSQIKEVGILVGMAGFFVFLASAVLVEILLPFAKLAFFLGWR